MAEPNDITPEVTAPNDGTPNESARLVMSQLVEQLVKHYKISRAEARMTIREVLMEL